MGAGCVGFVQGWSVYGNQTHYDCLGLKRRTRDNKRFVGQNCETLRTFHNRTFFVLHQQPSALRGSTFAHQSPDQYTMASTADDTAAAPAPAPAPAAAAAAEPAPAAADAAAAADKDTAAPAAATAAAPGGAGGDAGAAPVRARQAEV